MLVNIKNKKKGFSLIELMVVMVIIGLLMGMVTTNLSFLVPGSKLVAGARGVASTVVLAHNRAAINGKDVIVSYDFDKNTYQIILTRNGEFERMKAWELPDGIRYHDILVAGEDKKVSGIFQVYVSPIGIVRGHIVHVKDKQGKMMSVEVNPISGAVDVLDGYKEMDFVEED